ncbi:uncharacterized protein GBIM_11939 [Gryllus bimaculatus]|nr:uncharacterized protein GBIM_11939 [Gryllus bimaculatus]
MGGSDGKSGGSTYGWSDGNLRWSGDGNDEIVAMVAVRELRRQQRWQRRSRLLFTSAWERIRIHSRSPAAEIVVENLFSEELTRRCTPPRLRLCAAPFHGSVLERKQYEVKSGGSCIPSSRVNLLPSNLWKRVVDYSVNYFEEVWMRMRRVVDPVSFGSSKGSMVETLVYESPLREEPEAISPSPEAASAALLAGPGADPEALAE